MSWDIETKLPVPCYGSTGIQYKKKIYIFGGISRKGIHKRAWNYDLETKIWCEMKNLPNIRNYMSCHEWNGNLYLLGGWGIDVEIMSVRTPQILKYSIEDNKWYNESELPYPLTNIATCIYKDSLYVFGGMTKKFEFTRYIAVDSAFRYDLNERRWYDLPNLPYAKKDFSAEVINDEIYIFGGCSHDQVFNDIWKFSNNEWTLEGLLPINVCCYSLVKINTSLYLLGGMTDNFNVTKSIWRIETDNFYYNNWINVGTIPISLSYFTCSYNNDYIYVIGGFSSNYRTRKDIYRYCIFPWAMERQIWIGNKGNNILSKLPIDIVKIIIKMIK